MGGVVAVYQPRYLPRLHYLARARAADAFVLLDDVEFSRRSRQHRAELRHGDRRWLTVPVRHAGEDVAIVDAEVDADSRWAEKHYRTLRHEYGGEADRFEPLYDRFSEAETLRLAEVTVPTLRSLFEAFGVGADVRRSSAMAVPRPADASAYLARLVAALDGGVYLAGRRGYREYLDLAPFDERGVDVRVQDWTPRWPEGNVCALDVLFGADDPAAHVAPEAAADG